MHIEKPKKGHKPNMAMKRKRERYRVNGRRAVNKRQQIEKMLATATGEYRAYLEDRLAYWRGQ